MRKSLYCICFASFLLLFIINISACKNKELSEPTLINSIISVVYVNEDGKELYRYGNIEATFAINGGRYAYQNCDLEIPNIFKCNDTWLTKIRIVYYSESSILFVVYRGGV